MFILFPVSLEFRVESRCTEAFGTATRTGNKVALAFALVNKLHHCEIKLESCQLFRGILGFMEQRYLKECHGEDGMDMFSVVLDDRTWTNDYNLH